MAMDMGGAKGGVKSDINVTPLVDVMLVLLIIMMIVAPLLQKGADVKLPVAAYSADKPETQDQTVVAIDSQGRFFVNGVPVREEELRQRVEDIPLIVTGFIEEASAFSAAGAHKHDDQVDAAAQAILYFEDRTNSALLKLLKT